MKKALILGTGDPQYDAIKYLKENGWWVIACSYRREGRGVDIADQFELVDIINADAVEDLGRREKIDLIYSVGSELAMLTVTRAAPRLGLASFLPYEKAALMNNKIMLRNLLTANNVSPVKYKMVSSEADLEDWDIFPAIVKPADSQGARGVFRADSMERVKAGLPKSISYSRSNSAIIEEFLDGTELSVSVFVIDSQVVFNEVSDRLVMPGYPSGIFPRGHRMPSEWCRGQDLQETKALVNECTRVLEIENGPVYYQIRLGDKGPKILEITPRLDGCHVWKIIKTVTGVDLMDACFRLLMGDKSMNMQVPDQLESYRKLFFLCPPGRVYHDADFVMPEGALFPEHYYQDGETVRPINGFMEKVSYYFMKGKGNVPGDYRC